MWNLVILAFILSASSLVAVSQAVTCQCGKAGDAINTRVVFGGTLGDRSHPFLVYIEAEEDLCGGSIISPRFVLTAAHCLENKTREDVNLVVGISDRLVADDSANRYTVEDIIIHEQYRDFEDTPMNDIALLKTTTDITFNDYVQPVCLPFKLDLSKFKSGLVMGWGLTEFNLPSQYPSAAYVTLLKQQECLKSWYLKLDLKMMLCAANRVSDACQGDSGGPLVVRDPKYTYFLIGIVSFGEDCGRYGYPGIYINVQAYLSWIQEHVNDLCTPE